MINTGADNATIAREIDALHRITTGELAERYELSSLLETSNLAFSKWDQIFKDAMTTAAAIDRLVHHSVIIELNVPSYRVETAKQSKSKPRPKANAKVPATS